ncbi:hypothetical protein KDX05_07065 [Burkholderia vietnamiensis]|uniref:hypothetical protein n=1 Tax=Burkholderia vietnamiensis TaxID=60552 RepID=UPI001B9C8D1D|nr:hypothetical protein [Burkholderia vietnamiensis]MBR8228071.1 hypothetical protein [Burkholderia vietnamiensis]
MNCKPGDLAIIVQAFLPENIGKIVEVLAPLGDDCGCGFRWLVKTLSPARTISVIDFKTVFEDSEPAGIPDAWLRPVTGLPITDDVEDEVMA